MLFGCYTCSVFGLIEHKLTPILALVEYEGPEALEARPHPHSHPPSRANTEINSHRPSPLPPATPPPEEDFSNEDSGDEYVAEDEGVRKRLKGKVRFCDPRLFRYALKIIVGAEASTCCVE